MSAMSCAVQAICRAQSLLPYHETRVHPRSVLLPVRDPRCHVRLREYTGSLRALGSSSVEAATEDLAVFLVHIPSAAGGLVLAGVLFTLSGLSSYVELPQTTVDLCMGILMVICWTTFLLGLGYSGNRWGYRNGQAYSF